MKPAFALFYHSLVSDWNHGNAHFLRGILSELQARGHQVRVFEPHDSWSRANLIAERGLQAVEAFHRAFPSLRSETYDLQNLRLEERLDAIDVVLVHEWNDPELIAAVGAYRRRNPNVRVFFHDTHHRAFSAEQDLARFELSEYDGVLAYGASLKHAYERLGWGKSVYVWHEAADVRTFYPREPKAKLGDVVWIGNWGDNERTEELREFLIEPIRNARLRAQVFGVRYPEFALSELAQAGIAFGGSCPNFEVPEIFASFRATVHVPRRPYTKSLPGIPTIRPFEALACGIPLVSAPWQDSENLFRAGRDFLMAQNGSQMQKQLQDVIKDDALAQSLRANGLETIRSRHTCGHRVHELLSIYEATRPLSAREILQCV